MEFKTRHFGGHGNKASSIIELTISDFGGNSEITEDITNLDGLVDDNLISGLRELADELEEHNEKIKNK
ncbi:hypothetical protein [Salinimicrobium sp. GXAS 041]|uniref:hypothetical protein n=1 Tax=Salinimicrobium sp. GXAS 041 TaxID=3400806 RepID=UPI003C70B632